MGNIDEQYKNMDPKTFELYKKVGMNIFGKSPMLGETPELEAEAVVWFKETQERLEKQKRWHKKIEDGMKELEAENKKKQSE